MKQIPALFAATLLASAVASCAAAQEGTETAEASDAAQRCILVRNIDTYRPIDRNHVVIVARGEEAFLLGTMQPGCWDIERSAAISIETAPISICEGQTATLMVRGERCYVRTLESVSSMESAESLVESRSEQ